jgi:hypothetical protein
MLALLFPVHLSSFTASRELSVFQFSAFSRFRVDVPTGMRGLSMALGVAGR